MPQVPGNVGATSARGLGVPGPSSTRRAPIGVWRPAPWAVGSSTTTSAGVGADALQPSKASPGRWNSTIDSEARATIVRVDSRVLHSASPTRSDTSGSGESASGTSATSASATLCAESNRDEGSGASSACTSASSRRGTSGAHVVSVVGSASSVARRMAAGGPGVIHGRPLSRRQARAPRAYRSVRGSSGASVSCSGEA